MKRMLAALLLLAAPSLAGPPAICWPVEIGEAKSLPWGDSGFEPDASYDRARVVKDTLALLGSDTPVLVRMETLRRAALYVAEDRARRDALLTALMKRVLEAEAIDQPDALAWFDAGYAAGCFAQLGEGHDLDGYLWVKKAIELRADPAMELAGAVLTLMGDHPHHGNWKGHVERAHAGAGTLLQTNLKLFAERAAPLVKYFEERAKRQEGGK